MWYLLLIVLIDMMTDLVFCWTACLMYHRRDNDCLVA